MISKSSGGLGFDISTVRHSEIRETGWSNGIIPMIQLYNYMVRYVDQNGRRKGAATIFLRPHHIDIEDFVELPRKVGDKYARAHDINICLWTSWIFWQRVRSNGTWTLFCPARVPQLNELYGEEFTKAYIAAEADPTIKPHHKKVINARDLYNKIRDVQRETGMPYLMDGDGANLKSNHRHLGYIKSSNLCLEIIEYTDDETIAVCNLHSLSLRMFGKHEINREISDVHEALREAVDFQQLANMSQRVNENLNKVIDHNWYPLDKVKEGKFKPGIIHRSNKRHRPVGMGASGFAELLHILDLPFEDPIVLVLNKMIFACMYWNAMAQSIQLAIRDGPYESFHGSPTSHGKFQFDLWKEEFDILGPNSARKKEDDEPIDPSSWGQNKFYSYSPDGESIQDTILPTWDDLRRCMMKYGLRNSLFIALMPTASTAQVRRNCESVEAHQNNMYSRKVLKCSYPVLNRYLVNDLEKEGLCNNSAIEYIKVKNGSVQGFSQYIASNPNLFPNFSGNQSRILFLEKKYKTMWEIPQRLFLKLAADRSRYIDQSSSTNIYIRDCTDEKLSACHLYANMLGLKTLMYYLRQKGGETIKFTADPSMIQHIEGISVEAESIKNKDEDHNPTNSISNATFTDTPLSQNGKIVCTDDICTSCT
jgi:ribonucleoside-diphosphate reductase alpha chain